MKPVNLKVTRSRHRYESSRRTRAIRRRPLSPAARHIVPSWDIGIVLMVPNHFYHFTHPTSTDHPGIFLGIDANEAIFLKGTDANCYYDNPNFERLEPTRTNGLTKSTAFRLVECRVPMHKAQLLFPERWLGLLAAEELIQMQCALAYAVRDNPPSLSV